MDLSLLDSESATEDNSVTVAVPTFDPTHPNKHPIMSVSLEIGMY